MNDPLPVPVQETVPVQRMDPPRMPGYTQTWGNHPPAWLDLSFPEYTFLDPPVQQQEEDHTYDEQVLAPQWRFTSATEPTVNEQHNSPFIPQRQSPQPIPTGEIDSMEKTPATYAPHQMPMAGQGNRPRLQRFQGFCHDPGGFLFPDQVLQGLVIGPNLLHAPGDELVPGAAAGGQSHCGSPECS